MNEEKLYKKTKALLRKWGVSDEEAEDFIKDLKDTADRDDDGDVIDDVKRAEDKIEAEGKDSQTEKDRVDEAVGDDLADDDDEDNQSTDDRVDEAEGEDKHIEEVHEESHEEVREDRIGRLEEKIDKMIAFLINPVAGVISLAQKAVSLGAEARRKSVELYTQSLEAGMVRERAGGAFNRSRLTGRY
ncbi:MAG: hypothetical protein IJ735_00035 [Clostridia bacterium]|nr:hypothetical protein [Clostridia bacterium]